MKWFGPRNYALSLAFALFLSAALGCGKREVAVDPPPPLTANDQQNLNPLADSNREMFEVNRRMMEEGNKHAGIEVRGDEPKAP